jgi:outer membrane protein TolC
MKEKQLIYEKNVNMKNNHKYKIPALLLILLISLLKVFSQQEGDSLGHYLEIAAKNNPGVLQKFTEYKAALQKIPQAGSLPDPELNLGVFLQPMELVSGNQVADIRLMQMFPWFGVLKNARDEMSLMANAKFELFRDAKLNLYYDIQRTWYDLIKYRQEIRLSESYVEILKTIERLTLIRFKSPLTDERGSSSGGIIPGALPPAPSLSDGMKKMGAGNANITATGADQGSGSMTANTMGAQTTGSGLADIYRIQIEIGDLENNIESLKNLIRTLSARFNSYLNRQVMSPVSLPDTLIPEILESSLAAVTDSMLANNPMLGMLKYEHQSLEARSRMVTAMGYPMVGLGINYSLINKSEMSASSMNGKDMIMPMVTVTIPLYRKKYNALKTETELMKNANSLGSESLSNSLKAEFYEALQLYQDASRRQKLYADQSQLADNSLSIMLKSFSSSGASLTEILRVRQQTLDFKLKEVEAIADFNTSVAWLRRLGNLQL